MGGFAELFQCTEQSIDVVERAVNVEIDQQNTRLNNKIISFIKFSCKYIDAHNKSRYNKNIR